MPERTRIEFKDGAVAGGFTQAHNVVLFSSLSHGAKVLYLQLRHRAWAGGDATQEELAAGLNIKRRALHPYLVELVEARLVENVRRGHGLPNVYVIAEPDEQFSAHQDGRIPARLVSSSPPIPPTGPRHKDGGAHAPEPRNSGSRFLCPVDGCRSARDTADDLDAHMEIDHGRKAA